MKVSDKALVIFALILISFLAALISYKGFGESDNKEHLPMLYRMIDSSYLKNDWFVNENSSIFNVRIYFHYLMFGLHFLISNIAILYFIIFFIAYLGTAHASFLISKHLNGNDGSALLVTSLILIGGSFTLGGNFIIHDVTTPHLLAFTLSLYGIYFILKERYVWFSVFLGLATMIHFLLGGLIFGVVLLSDIIRRKKKAKILLPILVFLPFALFLIPMFLAQVSSGAHLSGQQFTFIDAYFKHPHHQVPFSWSPLLYIEFVLFLGLFIYSYINLRKISKDMIIIPYSIIIIAALCFIGAVTVEFYPIKFITQLQFFRLTTLVSFFEYQIIGLLIYFALSKKSLAKTPDILPFHATSDKGDYFAICDAIGKQFKIFNGNAEEIIDLSESNILMPKCFFMEEIGKLIVTGSNTSLATLIDLKQKKIIGQIANAVNDNFFLITPELYYMGSKDFIKNMRFKYNSEIFSFEQFDAYLNQPHKVLRAFGSNDSVLIKAYETAYLKRMKVLGIKPGSKINFSSIPQFQFIKLQEQSAGNIQFSLSVNKGAGKLKRLLIFNNGSLVHSEFIKDEYSAHFEKNITFESTSGINRFEFIVKDENGLESPRTSRLYNNTTIVKPNLFLVVIASEKFKDTRFDLAYAVKDAGDMAKTMSNSKSFNKIEIKKLFNQSFTSDSVKQLKGFFDKAGINDVVMVFFAGHGYLDEDLSYYFPSYYTDFTDPKINAVAYKEFEKLFQQMKPIRKLMFIDACFSGEVDDDIFTDDAGEEEKKKKDGRDIRLAGKTFAQTTAMEMAKVVFSDLRQNSGATIISSAGGTETAFEGEKWNNGLFTHCLLEGLSNYKADLNHDKKITLSELQKFVAEEVNSLSGGKQTPTYRLENTMLDYELW